MISRLCKGSEKPCHRHREKKLEFKLKQQCLSLSSQVPHFTSCNLRSGHLRRVQSIYDGVSDFREAKAVSLKERNLNTIQSNHFQAPPMVYDEISRLQHSTIL